MTFASDAGRGLTPDQITAHRAAAAQNKGLYSRLSSHAAGRRSGDQFCVYVADRLVLHALSSEQIGEIAAGRLSLDALVRTLIHTYLAYRFIEVADGAEAQRIEAAIQIGVLAAGKPLLSLRQSSTTIHRMARSKNLPSRDYRLGVSM